MSSIPSRVSDRIIAGLKRFQPIVQSAKARDVNESDTVIIVTDMLSYIFGYDKYSEITSEFAIRGTYCDLATKIDGRLQALIEVKSVGGDLKDGHTKQAVDYAANQGCEWVLLTNGQIWRVYRVIFGKPVSQELVVEFDFLSLNPKSTADLDVLFLIAKEGWVKSAISDYHTQQQALSRFCIAAVIQTGPVLDVIRRELRRMSPDVRIDNDQINTVIVQEVLKRDVIEGEKADEARRKIARAVNRAQKAKAAAASANGGEIGAKLEQQTSSVAEPSDDERVAPE